MKYFRNVKTIEDLKKAYRKYAMELHPDHGGNEAEFVAMDDEYNKILDLMKKGKWTVSNEDDADTTTAEEIKIAEEFRNAVKAVLHCDGVIIDMVGCWLWLSGNTYQHRATISAAGYHWSKSHKMWFFNGSATKSHRNSHKEFSEITDKYGIKRVAVGKGSGANRLKA